MCELLISIEKYTNIHGANMIIPYGSKRMQKQAAEHDDLNIEDDMAL